MQHDTVRTVRTVRAWPRAAQLLRADLFMGKKRSEKGVGT